MEYYLPFGPEIQLGQPFGARPNMSPNPPGGHNGDDWLTWIGVPVRSPGYGTVIHAGTFDSTYADNFGWNLNYGGNMVVINMDGDFEPYFEFGHLLDFNVKAGDRVAPGQIFARTGNTDGGTNVSTGPHCHVGCLPWNFNLNSNTYGRVNPRLYMTKHWVPPVVVPPAELPKPKPKEWDEMATKEDIKDALREVVLEAPVLDAIALTILKRDCFLVDPTGKTGEVVGKTSLAKKINWMAHNDAQTLNLMTAIGSALGVKMDELLAAHLPEPEELEMSVPALEVGPVSGSEEPVEPKDG